MGSGVVSPLGMCMKAKCSVYSKWGLGFDRGEGGAGA